MSKRTKSTSKKKEKKLSYYIKKLDIAFSKYIRVKHAGTNGFCRCISCGKMYHWTKIQNGHYMSRRYYSTRFSEDNCRPQCVACNIFEHGNILLYRENLIREIGEERVESVQFRARNDTKRWSAWELEQLEKYYKALTEKIRNEKGI